MVLTDKQEEGLNIILQRHKNNEKYTVVAGYAGTGKSTLVRFAIKSLGVASDRVAYATYTGKAAEVLRKKGNAGACTLHRLLFDHLPLPSGGFFRKPKPRLNVDVVVVDEVSMVPKTMIDLLLKHKVYIIFLGDPFQLPQIDKKEENHLLDKPHIFLDEIMRQAAESEIIQLTMKIRNGEPLEEFHGKEVQVLSRNNLNTGMLTWADQILVATNARRQAINNQVRDLLGYSGNPQEGERMICLRNYWDDTNSQGDVLVNGTTGTIKNVREGVQHIPSWIATDKHDLPTIDATFIPDGGWDFDNVRMDKKMIETGEKCLDWRAAYQLGKLRNKIGDIVPKEYAYAYAITCHKAQGSEWDNVLVLEESFPYDKTEHARWLYTACTRASEKLVLVRG